MARKAKPKETVIVDGTSAPEDDKATKGKRKEFRDLKARYMELRETLKAASTERKALEERLAPMAAELGLSFKGVKNSPPATS